MCFPNSFLWVHKFCLRRRSIRRKTPRLPMCFAHRVELWTWMSSSQSVAVSQCGLGKRYPSWMVPMQRVSYFNFGRELTVDWVKIDILGVWIGFFPWRPAPSLSHLIHSWNCGWCCVWRGDEKVSKPLPIVGCLKWSLFIPVDSIVDCDMKDET